MVPPPVPNTYMTSTDRCPLISPQELIDLKMLQCKRVVNGECSSGPRIACAPGQAQAALATPALAWGDSVLPMCSLPGCVILWIMYSLDNSHYSPETLTKTQMWNRPRIPSTQRLAGLEIDKFHSREEALKALGSGWLQHCSCLCHSLTVWLWASHMTSLPPISSAVKWKSKLLLYLNHRVGMRIK